MEEFRESSNFADAKMEKTNVDIECKTEDFTEFPNVTVKTEPEVGWPESSAHNDTVTKMENDDNNQSADIKHESEFPNNDVLPNNTEEGVRRWTVWSSTIMPVDEVKSEESSILDHGHIGFEPATLFNVNDSSTCPIQNNTNVTNIDGSTVNVSPYETSALTSTIKKSDKIKPHMCYVCGKSFKSPRNLTRHHGLHTGERPYQCDICDKNFALSSTLKNHQRIHTGEKLYKCDVCNKEFNQYDAVTKHMRIHTGEKPYKCDVCMKEFTQLCILTGHQRIHTGEKPYKCDVCGKEFNQSGTLTKHQRIHTGEKPYKCDVCDKEFTWAGSLREHRNIHTGERKPYNCDVCKKEFHRYGKFRDHQHSHAGEKS